MKTVPPVEQPKEIGQKRPRDDEDDADTKPEIAAEAAAEEDATPQINPETIFTIKNNVHLVSLRPKISLSQTHLRNILKKHHTSGAVGSNAVYIVSKATECLLTELVHSSINVANQRIITAAAAASTEGNPAPPAAKRAKLFYDDLQSGFEALKTKSADGITPDLEFLNRILPKKGEKPKLYVVPKEIEQVIDQVTNIVPEATSETASEVAPEVAPVVAPVAAPEAAPWGMKEMSKMDKN